VENGSSSSAYNFTATLSKSGVAEIVGEATKNIKAGEKAKFYVKGLAAGDVDVNIQNSNQYGDDYVRKGVVHLTVADGTTPPAPESFKVTFDVQGHGTAPADQTVEAGKKVTKPDDPTADGYDFGGWFKEKACETAWDFGTDTVSAATTIYALWTPKSEQTIETAKNAAKEEIDGIVADKKDTYNEAVQAELNKLANDYKKAIDEAETKEAVESLLNEFKDKQEKLITTEGIENAKTLIDQLAGAEYSDKFYDVQKKAFDKLVSDSKKEIESAINMTDISNAISNFSDKAKEIPTKTDINETIIKLDAAVPADVLSKYPEDQQKKITDLLGKTKDAVTNATTKT
jgi:uncharacterized repeat protein (TIGR02543 family)